VIDFTPSEEQSLIIETVHQFAQKEIRELARTCDEDAAIPATLLDSAHELGLVANGLPEEFGGGGERSALTGCLIAEELAWGDLAIASAILSPSLAGHPIADFGSEAQRKAHLPALLGERFCGSSLAIVEPDFDFDVYRPRTRAELRGDEYVLNGRKCLTPWLADDGPLLVVASEGDTPQTFLVARDAAGLTATPESNMGTRALPTAELALEDVRIPASARLGEKDGSDVRDLIVRSRVGLASLAVGMARAAFEISIDYAKERETFGAPIATRQAIAFKLADMVIEIDGARLLTWEAAWRLDRGLDATREATLAIQQARRVVREVSDGSVQVFGGYGYIREYLPELFLRNSAGIGAFEGLTLV
jgi:alkylation response protein AidB-like acyl-CoA dehydrogenase